MGFGSPAAIDQGPICLEIKTKTPGCPSSRPVGITEVTQQNSPVSPAHIHIPPPAHGTLQPPQMSPFFCREMSKDNADSPALTSSTLVVLSLCLQGRLGWPSPAAPPNMRPRRVPSKGRKGLVPRATCAFCPGMKTALPKGSNAGSPGPMGQTPGCPLHPLPLTPDPHAGPSPWPINSCAWMDKQRCDLPRLTINRIFLYASWQHDKHFSESRLGEALWTNRWKKLGV